MDDEVEIGVGVSPEGLIYLAFSEPVSVFEMDAELTSELIKGLQSMLLLSITPTNETRQ